jgi:hypothetical protein
MMLVRIQGKKAATLIGHGGFVAEADEDKEDMKEDDDDDDDEDEDNVQNEHEDEDSDIENSLAIKIKRQKIHFQPPGKRKKGVAHTSKKQYFKSKLWISY